MVIFLPLPDHFLQELKARSDMVDVASSYLNLKRRGRNMVGLCPFHGEKTPSFNIYPENGSFYSGSLMFILGFISVIIIGANKLYALSHGLPYILITDSPYFLSLIHISYPHRPNYLLLFDQNSVCQWDISSFSFS